MPHASAFRPGDRLLSVPATDTPPADAAIPRGATGLALRQAQPIDVPGKNAPFPDPRPVENQGMRMRPHVRMCVRVRVEARACVRVRAKQAGLALWVWLPLLQCRALLAVVLKRLLCAVWRSGRRQTSGVCCCLPVQRWAASLSTRLCPAPGRRDRDAWEYLVPAPSIP